MSSLHPFTARPVHSDLRPLGIKRYKVSENATYQMRDGKLWKDIGSIFVYSDGLIKIARCADASPLEIGLLAGHAEEVWRGTVVPSKATAWHFRRRSGQPNYWFATILVPADAGRDAVAAEIEALRSPGTLADLRCRSVQKAVNAA